MGIEQLDVLFQRLERIEAALVSLIERQTVKDYYSTEEAAKLLGLAEFTVRNYCRLGRIQGEKRKSGRGKFSAWVISHKEILRVQREGLVPINGHA